MDVRDRDDTLGTAYGRKPSGFRMPAGLQLGRVRLQIADLARSLAFYVDELGFSVVERAGGRALLGAAGERVPLIELHELSGAVPASRRLGLFHFAILLPDRTSLGRFARRLVELRRRAGSADHLVSEAFYLQDPDGLGIEIYADRPRSMWQVRDQEIYMDTLPLDLSGLAEAAGNEPWSGIPPETVLGHVHLHVRDLDEAEAFYHGAVGLDVVVWSYPGARFLSAGGYHHHLGINTWAGAGAAPPTADQARLLDWEIVLPSMDVVRAAHESIDRAGYQVVENEGGRLTADPWGTSVRLSSETS